jgi:hypothetical protein
MRMLIDTDAADVLGVPVAQIHDWVGDGTLVAFRTANGVRVVIDDGPVGPEPCAEPVAPVQSRAASVSRWGRPTITVRTSAL